MISASSHSSQTPHWKYKAIRIKAAPAPSAINAKPRAAIFHTPHERPINPARRKIVSHTRPICSRGYKPIMKSVKLASITPQRASVVDHCTAGLRSAYHSQPARNVSAMLYQVLKRFFCTHARGPTVRTGGFTSTAVMSTLHQLNAFIVDIHQEGCKQTDAQVT